MMPVIRVSEETMERLGRFARPFIDKPEDVVRMALDALEKIGQRPGDPPVEKVVKKLKKRVGSVEKLPQREFHQPLIETLRELGGSAAPKDVRRVIEAKLKPLLKAGDYALVSTGDPRWWNAVCWARNDLVKAGQIVAREHGVWELA